MIHNRPAVLSFSGHDPSGGAGVQADIEAIVSHQCHAVSVITVLTEQDTRNVKKLLPQNPDQIIRLAKTIMADIPVKAIKIGLLGHADIALAIHKIITQHPNIPVVFDPVLAAGGGTDLSDDALISAINEFLLPYTTVLTPNSEEARRLTGLNSLKECGLNLLEKSCKYVLITGSHETTPEVHNLLFNHGNSCETYSWNRLPYSYHGSGCTLASSIAALLARGLDVLDAIAEAQEYTWNALNAAYQPGKGQYNPDRFFWVDDG
jgi:hydroxymethylpyrimidine/phosphomethylpyrimidine kinase